MDKALVFGTKDCRFESCQGHLLLPVWSLPGWRRCGTNGTDCGTFSNGVDIAQRRGAPPTIDKAWPHCLTRRVACKRGWTCRAVALSSEVSPSPHPGRPPSKRAHVVRTCRGIADRTCMLKFTSCSELLMLRSLVRCAGARQHAKVFAYGSMLNSADSSDLAIGDHQQPR